MQKIKIYLALRCPIYFCLTRSSVTHVLSKFVDLRRVGASPIASSISVSAKLPNLNYLKETQFYSQIFNITLQKPSAYNISNIYNIPSSSLYIFILAITKSAFISLCQKDNAWFLIFWKIYLFTLHQLTFLYITISYMFVMISARECPTTSRWSYTMECFYSK